MARDQLHSDTRMTTPGFRIQWSVRIGLLVAVSLMGMGVGPVYAHSFGQRYDLPIPLDYFLAGAAATVALSFVVIGLFVRHEPGTVQYPRLDLLRVAGLGAVLKSKVLSTAAKVVSVFLFLLVLATAFLGTDNSLENFSPTFVWIIWWVAMGYIAALIGDVWVLVNPWKIIYEWLEGLIGGVGERRRTRAMFIYPRGLDVWPAVVLFLVFAWLENVYSGAVVPSKLGTIIVVYSLITWGGMAAFGKHQWLRCGEAFSVLFSFFARFSPTEVKITDDRFCRTCGNECELLEGECVNCYECFEMASEGSRALELRPYAVGLSSAVSVSTATAAFVVLALATVTFDGVASTPFWLDYQNFTYPVARPFGAYAITVLDTLGLVLIPAVFMAVYLVTAWGIKTLSGEKNSVMSVATGFVFSLVPIALAYNMAHFISLLAIQGQYIIPLASDPFGVKWDLFGTYHYMVNMNIISAKVVWFISVGAIVVGHIASVYIAHIIAMSRTRDQVVALRGQYPMLVLMVIYTATSLAIIAQPIINKA